MSETVPDLNHALAHAHTLGLERIGWLEAQVTELKTLPAGWPVGYTGAYRTRRETRLAQGR